MGLEEHRKHAHGPVNCGVVTVTSSRRKETDISGKTIISLLESSGHVVRHYGLVKDETSGIKNALESVINDQGIQAAILNGGTGLGQGDVTVEAVKPLLEREIPGFGELFRYLSYKEIGSAAMLSRAIGGITKGKIVFCLPGSTNACKLAMEQLILPELGHIVYEMEK